MPPRSEPATYDLTDADLDILEDYRDRYKVAKRHQRKPILDESVTIIKKLEESEPVMTKVWLGVSQEVPKSINDLIGFFMRNWTPKSVLEYLMHEEIKEKQVEKWQEKEDPEGSFKYYQAAVSDLMKGLDVVTKQDHEKLAIEWNTLRPPPAVQQRAAEKRAMPSVIKFLRLMREKLGVYAQSGKKSGVPWGQLAVQPDLWIDPKWFLADRVFKDPSKMHQDDSYAVLVKLSDVTQNGIFRFLRLSRTVTDALKVDPVMMAIDANAITSGKSRGKGKASSKRKGKSGNTEGKLGHSGKRPQSPVDESAGEASSTDELDNNSGVDVDGQVGRHRPYISPYGCTEKDKGTGIPTAFTGNATPGPAVRFPASGEDAVGPAAATRVSTLPRNLFVGNAGTSPESTHPLGGDASVTLQVTNIASSSGEAGQAGVSTASAGKASAEHDGQRPHPGDASNLSEVRRAGNEQPLTDVHDERVNPATPPAKPGKKRWLVPVVEISSLGRVRPPRKKRKVDTTSVPIEPPKTPIGPPEMPRRSARQPVKGEKTSWQSGKAAWTPNGQSRY
ncbi:hypothetical protein JAAARDRAFT_198519 [Jaapia argillacea MUCL 33604]|uniref:Uncharacterized protein n=1 Tax=Jaapia argillacea MUCL 33604 TaxID=933084 RepID=A0A067PBG0_9AGAM|nr:hypothetical protein JAAARDRAFT_198519 [Jaapia argillacea MUCL 33604]